MTDQERIDLIHFMFRAWKATMQERMALKVLLNMIAAENPQFDPESKLKELRGSEVLQKALNDQFAGFEELLLQVGEDSLGKMARELTEKYGSKFHVH